MKKQTDNRIITTHQKKIASMVESFIMKATDKDKDFILNLWKQYEDDWHRRVKKINDRYEKMILSYDVWDRIWKVEGYLKVLCLPVPKQLPEEQKKTLIGQKFELIRIVNIVEEKTEKQIKRREDWYKFLFLVMRVNLFIKGLFKKEVTGIDVAGEDEEPEDLDHNPKMEIVK